MRIWCDKQDMQENRREYTPSLQGMQEPSLLGQHYNLQQPVLLEKWSKQTLDDTKVPTAHTSFLHEHSFVLSLNILALFERHREDKEQSRKKEITSLHYQYSREISKSQNKTPLKEG